MLHFGEQLKTVRQARGYRLDYVEDITGINRTYLHILEEGRYDKLPDEHTTIEIVSRYAAVLGICVADAVDDWQASFLSYRLKPEVRTDTPAAPADHAAHEALRNYGSQGGSRRPLSAFKPIPLLSGMPVIPLRNLAVAGAFLIFTLWLGITVVSPYLSSWISAYLDGSSTVAGYDVHRLADLKQIQPSRGEESPAELTAEASLAAPGALTAAVPAEIDLEIKAEQECWVKTTVDGEVTFEGILAQGQNINLSAKESIRLKTSSAGSLAMTFNGEALKPMGEINEVIEKEFR